MSQREYEITISPDGRVELHVKGFKGRRCLEVAKLFQELVGEMESQRHTSEFYEPEEQVRYNLEHRI